MCGILGYSSKDPIPLRDMRVVLDEIGVRGIHSTGVSWARDFEINTRIERVPYYEFEIPSREAGAAVFHTRYSTSNIEYPQPVCNESEAIVHNGVVTQADPDTWEKDYGYKGEYKCDSVLLLGSSGHPLERFPDSSMAVAKVHRTEVFSFYRNHQRPLYYIEHPGLVVVASTKRALEYFGEPNECEVNKVYTALKGKIVNEEIINKPQEDWQI